MLKLAVRLCRFQMVMLRQVLMAVKLKRKTQELVHIGSILNCQGLLLDPHDISSQVFTAYMAQLWDAEHDEHIRFVTWVYLASRSKRRKCKFEPHGYV